jgi:hypothetical protein
MDKLPLTQNIKVTVTKYKSEDDFRADTPYEQLVSHHSVPVTPREVKG